MEVTGPIGVFDSGYGGLTILKEIQQALPQYDYLYLGDNARAPYGNRSFDVIYDYTWEAVQALFDRGCSLVILACNTASAKALRSIQQKNLPVTAPNKRVLGVIRPSAEALESYSNSKHVGILATEGTVKSESYRIELAKFAPDLKVNQHACPMWVPLVENNQYTSEGGHFFIQQDIDLLLTKDEKIDTILLGCTHYPILQSVIESKLPSNIQVISQGAIVAASLVSYLTRHPEIAESCTQNGSTQFLTTENAAVFNEKASRLMDTTIEATSIHL
jgi:glutamate racemase